MSDLLKRIANYFANEYNGDDKTAPKMELSVDELRYIASMNCCCGILGGTYLTGYLSEKCVSCPYLVITKVN